MIFLGDIRAPSYAKLNYLAKFGSLTIQQLGQLTTTPLRTVHDQMQTLVRKKLVTVTKNQPHSFLSFTLTHRGIDTLSLPLKTKLYSAQANKKHRQTIIDFVTTNKLKLNDYRTDHEIKLLYHLPRTPDLVIVNPKIKYLRFQNHRLTVNPQIALEFELSLKTTLRYQKIVTAYETEPNINYFQYVFFFIDAKIYCSFLQRFHPLIFSVTKVKYFYFKIN